MKKLLLSLIALGASLTAVAQKPAYDPANGALLDGRNIVKFSPVGLAIKSYSFSYERILTKRLSVQLSYTTRGESAIAQLESSLGNDYAGLKMGYSAIMPELRLYMLGGGYGRGLYLAPYARFVKANLSDFNLEYKATASNNIAADGQLRVSGDLTSFNLGLGLGVQFYIAKYIVFDLSAGVHYAASSKINLQGVLDKSVPALTEEELGNLQKDAQDIVKDLPGSSLTVGVEGIKEGSEIRGAKLNAKGTYLFPRVDLSIGFRF